MKVNCHMSARNGCMGRSISSSGTGTLIQCHGLIQLHFMLLNCGSSTGSQFGLEICRFMRFYL